MGLQNSQEFITIPFEGKSLSDYFWRATKSTEKRSILIVLGDRFAEEMYFWGGAPAATRRGYHVLLIDQPGQGITPGDGLYTTASAEVLSVSWSTIFPLETMSIPPICPLWCCRRWVYGDPGSDR